MGHLRRLDSAAGVVHDGDMQMTCAECNGGGVVYFYHQLGVEGRRAYTCAGCDGIGYTEESDEDDEED